MLVTSPVTFPLTVLTTSEEYSGSLEVDMSENHPTSSSVKWEILPFFLSKSFLDATCRAQPPAGCKCIWEKLARNWITHCKQALRNIHESPWRMIPIPAALVCPWQKILVIILPATSIDFIYHKCGVFRQSWSRHVRESPNFFKREVRSLPFFCQRVSWMQPAWHINVQVARAMGKARWKPDFSAHLSSKYCETFMNPPGIWFPSQQHGLSEHATLWQKMLPRLAGPFRWLCSR